MPTTITVSTFQPGPGECNFLGTTCKLRRYYDSDWMDVDGVFHAAGVVGSSTDFFDEISCTLASNTITVPSFPVTPTVTAQIGTPTETWQLWDQAGSARNVIFEGFIPSSPNPTTFSALLIANQGQTLGNPPRTYLDAIGVQQLIDAEFAALGGIPVTRETPSGVVDGTNPTFTLAFTPILDSEEVFVNGILRENNGADYSISGAVITMITIPESGDYVRVSYRR